MNNIYLLSAVLPLISCSLYGNAADTTDKCKRPKYIQLQYAGNMGLLSVGFGKSFFSEKLTTCLIYGYLPGSINGVTVHTLAIKTSFTFINKPINQRSFIGGYFGTSLLRGFTRNTFITLPDYYPSGYYSPNAFHLALFTGAKHSKLIEQNKWFEKVSTFIEFGTLDYIIWYSIKTQYINFFDLWNISFGLSLNFNKSKK